MIELALLELITITYQHAFTSAMCVSARPLKADTWHIQRTGFVGKDFLDWRTRIILARSKNWASGLAPLHAVLCRLMQIRVAVKAWVLLRHSENGTWGER
jgi:hypothetical protein